MARPRKYTRAALHRAIEAYFDSISREITVMEEIYTGERDEKGHLIPIPVPVRNRAGEEMTRLEYVIPPTVGGLCAYLGIDRSTWAAYCDRPEFRNTTTQARERMRAYLESELLTREGKNVRGIIFNLQANYGLSEKREVELGPRAARTVTAAEIPLAEREALLREIAKDFSEEDGGAET